MQHGEASLRTLQRALRAAFAEVRREGLTMLLKKGSAAIEEHGSFGDTTHDANLTADRRLGEIIVDALKAQPYLSALIRRIRIEGAKDADGAPTVITLHADGIFDAFIDPLDNSQGYYVSKRQREREPFPSPHLFASVLTLVDVLPAGQPTRFSDVLAGVVQPLHPFDPELEPVLAIRGLPWPEARRIQPYATPLFKPRDKGGFGSDDTILSEGYYPGTRGPVAEGFQDFYGALRSWGCAALEMVSVACGHARANLCFSQKMHELGAAFVIHQAAGGVALTWTEGLDRLGVSLPIDTRHVARHRQPLADAVYVFDKQIPVILAASEEDAAALCARLKIR